MARRRRRVYLIQNANHPYGPPHNKTYRSREPRWPWEWIAENLGIRWPGKRRGRRRTVRRRR